MSRKNLRTTPPAVNAIAAEIISSLSRRSERVPSSSVVMEEAKKIQKRLAKKWSRLASTDLQSALIPSFDHLPAPRKPVINATGVILHTNLGRAPLGEALLERLSKVLGGYVNLELELQKGDRGGRTAYLDALFNSMVKGYKPVWVNNGAAAVLLCLSALKKAYPTAKLVVSRGELIEIGGGFRVPEIMKESGFEILEIGTTNKTRLRDYEKVLKKGGVVVCAVHPSNFIMRGFVESVRPEDLIPLCRKYKAPLIYDAGSLNGEALRKLPRGFTAVTTSTDKSLGGPQGGLIAAGLVPGGGDFQHSLLESPLYRAFRLGKIGLTALEFTFECHAEKKDRDLIPVSAMLSSTTADLEMRARKLTQVELKNFELQVVDCEATLGGGSLPGQSYPSKGLAVVARNESKIGTAAIVSRLRRGEPAVLASVVDGKAVLNLKTIVNNQIENLQSALIRLDRNFRGQQK